MSPKSEPLSKEIYINENQKRFLIISCFHEEENIYKLLLSKGLINERVNLLPTFVRRFLTKDAMESFRKRIIDTSLQAACFTKAEIIEDVLVSIHSKTQRFWKEDSQGFISREETPKWASIGVTNTKALQEILHGGELLPSKIKRNPPGWKETSSLLAGPEIYIYEHFSDERTSSRMKSLCRIRKELFSKEKESFLLEMRESLWALVRRSYINFLLSFNGYPTACKESVFTVLAEFQKVINKMPADIKEIVRRESAGILSKEKIQIFSTKEMENLLEKISSNIRIKEEKDNAIGASGENNIRMRILARRKREGRLDSD